MWRNDIKCKYMFMFPLKNVARKGLNQMEWNLKPGRPMWPETSSMNFKISMVWESLDFSDSWATCILSYLPLLCHLRWISLLFYRKWRALGLPCMCWWYIRYCVWCWHGPCRMQTRAALVNLLWLTVMILFVLKPWPQVPIQSAALWMQW